MVAILLGITAGGAYLGSVVVARHRAQAAADLAALAAAARLPAGPETACGQATLVAREMRADDIECMVRGLDVVVTVEVAVPLGWLGDDPLHSASPSLRSPLGWLGDDPLRSASPSLRSPLGGWGRARAAARAGPSG